jgi:hypothetical protein
MTQLEDLDEAIQRLATEGIATVAIGNKTVTVKSLDELLAWRKQLQADSAANRVGAGFGMQKIIPTY